MAMQPAFEFFLWKDWPLKDTSLEQYWLNKINNGLKITDDRVRDYDTTKFDSSEADKLVKDVLLNEDTGVLTILHYDGSSKTYQSLLGKISVNFDFDRETQKLFVISQNGDRQEIDLSAFIAEYEFLDSDTVSLSVGQDGKVTAAVRDGSIQEKHLQPNYLAEIKIESGNAEASANLALEKAGESEASALLSRSYCDGSAGVREGEDTDNSKYYSNQSKASADTSKEYLGKVEQAGNEAVQKLQDALDVDAPSFQMDLSTGHLMYGGGRFVFNVNGNGHLEWGLAV